MIDPALTQLNETMKELRQHYNEADLLRAILLEKFGPTSRLKDKYGFRIHTEGIHNTATTEQILYAVLEGLTKYADAQAKEVAELQFAINDRARSDREDDRSM